ncbi:MAG: diguanylate cyclase [Deltaproteobacteria bacterium]|nr:diguanylate cyclase [Deltaproteobacteria bacterium]
MREFKGYVGCEKIYESSTSLVFRGRRASDDEPVVIKMLKGVRPSIKELARYRSEYRHLSSLDLPSVIAVKALEEFGHSLLLITEDYGADSLKLHAARGRFPLPELLAIFIAVAESLSLLHERYIVHKDINPSNIVYNPVTKVCKLIDFGLAVRISPTNPGQRQNNALEGTLAYISPEQTGRMNRQIDYRTDLYSLGVTMYELLTGRLPFEAAHPIELVHAHIAGTPRPAHEVNPAVPPILSAMVAKLMAKMAEERYQSAAGLLADLEICRDMLQNLGQIEPFPLGREDHLNIFYLPQKLYGREAETAALLDTFNQEVLEARHTAFLLVSGYSGTGKTSLVKEVYKPITQSKGYFVEGKFDQHQRAIPYFAFKQALGGLVNAWLAESGERLATVAAGLQEALGAVGQVMVELIPSLELVLGSQPEVTPLAGVEAQNRFNYVCRNFFRAAATPEHPLVIFLDDLQWADLASLNLLATLLTDREIKSLFFIGAYRDNETPPSHPLLLSLESLAKKGIRPRSIHIGNLGEDDVALLGQDALHAPAGNVRELARLIHKKTLGNPFFVTQFLKTLYADGLIAFDTRARQWRWDPAEIRQRDIPDDVVQLMADKIATLSPDTQALLKLAACIGNAFSLDTLGVISPSEGDQLREDLREAVSEGLIIANDLTSFRFSHDRIQQACYSLMRNREVMHLQIGRLLLLSWDREGAGERVFEVVNQLDEARGLITDPSERVELARLNLQAGQRAKDGNAYAAAIRYLTLARDLLPPTAWQGLYALTFTIHCELAQCLHYAGETSELAELFQTLLTRSASLEDTIQVHMIRMLHHHLAGDYAGAVAIQKEALALLGVEVTDENLSAQLQEELASVGGLLGERSIESLEHAKLLDSPRHEMIMDILMELWTSAYLASQLELVAWSSCKMTNISLEHGNNHLTSYGYMNYAFVCVALLGQYEVGHRFGQVAIRLADRFDDLLMRGKAYLLFAVFINHWRAPLISSQEYSLKSFPLLVENGDWTYAGYCAEFAISDPTICGVSCPELHAEALRYLPFLLNNAPVVLDEFVRPACLNPLLQLLGLTRSDHTFDDDDFSEAKFLTDYQANPLALSYYYVAKLRSLYWFGYLDEAMAMLDKADFVATIALAQAKVPEMFFFACLTVWAAWENLGEEDRQRSLALVDGYQEKMQVWAENSPANFRHKHTLVEAERARVAGRDWEALRLYEAAITEAQEAGYVNNAALAHELCARFLLARDLPRTAAIHLTEARYAYQKWGAKAKVAHLDRAYRELNLAASSARRDPYSLPSTGTTHSSNETDSSSSVLDILAIVEASQSLASEINLEKLLNKLMVIVSENAGANRAVLLSQQGEGWRITAENRTGWEEVAINLGEEGGADLATALPLGLVNFCARKQEPIVLGSASKSGAFINDPYFASADTKSALALPLMHSRDLKGMLYLENTLLEDAFTRKHIKVLELLSTQIAISIENANFYKELGQLVEQRTAELTNVNQELQAANHQLEKISHIDGLTQIYNRRYLDEFIAREWKRHQRSQKDFALIICDIDYFKQYNDIYGHLEGDRCLKAIAHAIDQVASRPGDLVARYGGEEFVLVLSETNLAGVKHIIAKIQSSVRELAIPHSSSQVGPFVTLSLGALHVVPPADLEARDALYSADLTLYAAKSQGRNRAVVTEEVKAYREG